MRSNSHILKFFCFALLLGANYSANAGGPLVIEGPAGHTPVTFPNPNIILNIDPGPLGSRTNDEADTLIRGAFALWNSVTTATISLTQGPDLAVDINSTNIETVLPNADFSELHEDDGLNPIVYDNDGSIIDGFFGIGASQQTVGFAASIIFVGQSNFVEGYAVINGRDLPGLSALDFKLLVAHELGHLFGLDHTQTNIDNRESLAGNPSICQTANVEDYAIMYPFICRTSDSLHADDISAVSSLYPAANVNQQFGEITGFFVDTSGKAILGTNIWAEDTLTGVAISTVSDYLMEENGAYRLLLPAGNYTLHANSINTQFSAGSGIGPYSRTSSDQSFLAPHPIEETSYQGNTLGNDVVITVSNGSLTNIVFGIDGKTGTVAAAAVPNSGGGGGGGVFSPLSALFMILSLLVVRRQR